MSEQCQFEIGSHRPLYCCITYTRSSLSTIPIVTIGCTSYRLNRFNQFVDVYKLVISKLYQGTSLYQVADPA
jgi:hypothetical protein